MTTQLELTDSAESRRDAGISQVLEHNSKWADDMAMYFRRWLSQKPDGYEFIGETFRKEVTEMGCEQPRHHNAWGGLFISFVRSGLIKNTGRMEKMQMKESHARRSFVYSKCGE